MQQKRYKIINGKILTPYRLIEGGCILITGHKISGVFNSDIESAADVLAIDAKGCYVSPGFIDLHVHGGGGCDFMDSEVSAFLKIADTHARYGTTAMLPTTLSSSREELLAMLDIYPSAAKNNKTGAQFLGMHLEGPYFAMNQRGAQDPRFIRDPDPEEYESIINKYPFIKRWSAAPELKGALKFGRYMSSRGILAALAHTDAVYEEVLVAFENGYTLATHLYSGMSGLTRKNAYRFAGAIESAYIIEAMDVEIIADGIHVPPPLLKLVYTAKGASRIALVTDAIRAAGTSDKETVLGRRETGTRAIIEDGIAKLPDRSSFAGSVATADRLIRTMIKEAGVSVLEAIQMMTVTPARILNVHQYKGSLTDGKDADIILFDENIQVKLTMIKGAVVWSETGDFTQC